MLTSQRTIKMKENFMKYHNDGRTISEIAEIFNVSVYTIYNNLQEIADKNNVTRESLLLRVHKPHEISNSKNFKEQVEINPEELLADFEEVSRRLNNINETIDSIVKEHEEEF